MTSYWVLFNFAGGLKQVNIMTRDVFCTYGIMDNHTKAHYSTL